MSFIKVHHQNLDVDSIPIGKPQPFIINCDSIEEIGQTCSLKDTLRDCAVSDYDKFNKSYIQLRFKDAPCLVTETLDQLEALVCGNQDNLLQLYQTRSFPSLPQRLDNKTLS